MKRLRHPIRAIREPFGTAGLVVACVALIAALGGTALAAAKLNSTQKKEVEKIAKKYAGKPGAPGAQGPAGANGKDGANGTNGSNGESVTLATATGCGVPGGTKLTVGASSKEVCNGKEGEEGEEGEEGPEGKEGKEGKAGSPWTAGGTLPEGAQLTGIWTAHADAAEVVNIPLSFPIHLAGLVAAGNIYWGAGNEEPEIEISPGVFEKTEFQKHCEKSAQNPAVAPGNKRTLCVYFAPPVSEPVEDFIFKSITPLGAGATAAGRAGAMLSLEFSKPSNASGGFAVSGG